MKLTRVAICRNAATSPPEADDARTRKMTSRLRERIDERGIGLFASQADCEQFLNSLPDVERRRWIEFLVKRHLVHVLTPGPVGIHEHDTLDDLKREYRDIADVVVCAHAHARALGLDNGAQGSAPPEVAPVCDLELVDAFGYDEARTEHKQAVQAGEDRETVWDEWIAPLAPRVLRLVIVDRYALRNELRPHSSETGFKWLLQRTIAARTETSPPLKLELVIENDKGGVSARDLSRTIESFGLRDPDPTTFQSVAVWLADEQFGQRHLHDRMIRFDGRVLDCRTGLQVFSEPTVYQATKISCGSFKESEEFLTKVESECIGARWRHLTRMWLDPQGTDRIQFDEATERP